MWPHAVWKRFCSPVRRMRRAGCIRRAMQERELTRRCACCATPAIIPQQCTSLEARRTPFCALLPMMMPKQAGSTHRWRRCSGAPAVQMKPPLSRPAAWRSGASGTVGFQIIPLCYASSRRRNRPFLPADIPPTNPASTVQRRASPWPGQVHRNLPSGALGFRQSVSQPFGTETVILRYFMPPVWSPCR